MAKRYSVPAYRLLETVQNVVREKIDAAYDITADAAELGANLTREHIRTRGTAKSGKAGRIETGKMLDSVDATVVHRSNDSFQARFGMGAKGVGNVEPYFSYQEGGFRHRNGVDVEGMFAVTDAREAVRQYLEMELGRID